MEKKIEVGQILYKVNNNRYKNNEIEEVKVEKIGKKYFHLHGHCGRYPVDKYTLRYTDKHYSQSYFQLYHSKQEILDDMEKSALLNLLYNHFSWSGKSRENTLEQLRGVVEILNLSPKQ